VLTVAKAYIEQSTRNFVTFNLRVQTNKLIICEILKLKSRTYTIFGAKLSTKLITTTWNTLQKKLKKKLKKKMNPSTERLRQYRARHGPRGLRHTNRAYQRAHQDSEEMEVVREAGQRHQREHRTSQEVVVVHEAE
jgi:hypothetical protein